MSTEMNLFSSLPRATAIEMVTNLAQSQHGRQYLAQQGIMDKISNMIIAADPTPSQAFTCQVCVRMNVDSLIQTQLSFHTTFHLIFESANLKKPWKSHGN